MDAEESLNLFGWFAFGFRKEEDGEQDAEDAETAKHPESAGTADGVLNVDKSQRDDESQKPIGEGGGRTARCFDFGRQNFAHHQPGHRSRANGESGNEEDQRCQR